MPYFAINPETDKRFSSQGATPLSLQNCMVEKSPKGSARRSGYFITPTPGRTLRATLQGSCRGLFSEPGCRGGNLFAPASSYFNEVASNYSYASVGTITGSDVVQMVPFQDDVAALSNAAIHLYNGSTFSTVSDGDAPSSPSTLTSVAYRLVSATGSSDGFGWGKAGLFNDYAADGAAADIYLPDPIVGQFEIGGELWSFNSRSTQIWQPTGGAEADAFALVSGATMRVGLAARDAIARVGDGAMFLGHDRRVYRTSGLSVVPIENRDLEIAIRDLTAAQINANAMAWSYRKGSKEYWGLSVGLERCFVYDVDLGLWHQRTLYNSNTYDVGFAATAFENTVMVGASSKAQIWSLEDGVYRDNATQTSTVTITIASPGVVTWASHNLSAGMTVQFSTTGALPTGITAGTTYYVIEDGLTSDAFQFSATEGGDAVDTSGTQSGVHTGLAASLIQREMTLHVPASSDVPLNRIVLDAEWFDQPLTGQGSSPTILLAVSMDGGATYADEREISVPANGVYNVRVQDWAFGLASSERGALIRIRITDPIGFAIWGCFVNPTPQEVP